MSANTRRLSSVSRLVLHVRQHTVCCRAVLQQAAHNVPVGVSVTNHRASNSRRCCAQLWSRLHDRRGNAKRARVQHRHQQFIGAKVAWFKATAVNQKLQQRTILKQYNGLFDQLSTQSAVVKRLRSVRRQRSRYNFARGRTSAANLALRVQPRRQTRFML